MAQTLRTRIQQLAASFAASLLDAIRAASLEELLAETGRRPHGATSRPVLGSSKLGAGGRLPRRSLDEIADVADRICTLLEGHPEGLRAEQIRSELALDAKELPRPLAEALSSRRVTKTGQKRATTYFAKGGAPIKRKRGRPPGRKKAPKPGSEETPPVNGAVG